MVSTDIQPRERVCERAKCVLPLLFAVSAFGNIIICVENYPLHLGLFLGRVFGEAPVPIEGFFVCTQKHTLDLNQNAMGNNSALPQSPLSATRQGLQKFSIICLDSSGKELGTIHGGESLELQFDLRTPRNDAWANGDLLNLGNPLVPKGTVRMRIVCEAGRGGW